MLNPFQPETILLICRCCDFDRHTILTFIGFELQCPSCHHCCSCWLLPFTFRIPYPLVCSWLYLGVNGLPKLEFKVVSSSFHAWYLWCSNWGDTSTHSVCQGRCCVRSWRQKENHPVISLVFETEEAGSNNLPGFWAVKQELRGGEGAPQEIKATLIIIYLLTRTKPFHPSALHRMRWGWGL